MAAVIRPPVIGNAYCPNCRRYVEVMVTGSDVIAAWCEERLRCPRCRVANVKRPGDGA